MPGVHSTVLARLLVLSLAVVLAACSARGDLESAAASEGVPEETTASPSPTIPPSIAPATATPTPTESPLPSLVIHGETPGPDATILPSDLLPARFTVDKLAALATSIGLECTSGPGAPPGWPGGFQIGCEGRDVSGQAELGLSALYWTFDAVVSFRLLVLPVGSEITDESIASEFFLPYAELVSDEAREWISDKINDPGCRDHCYFRSDGAFVSISVAESGARLLHVNDVRSVE